MDIYFCDECGARVTDLDLRAGKGMRRGHDTICPGCVDQGKAPSWLGRAGPAAVAAVAAAPAPAKASLIDAARDRAVTVPDDPFSVEEPKAPPAVETDAIKSSQPRPLPKQAKTEQAPVDGLAAAGGGFGALVGGPIAPPPGLVDDPEESPARRGDSDADPPERGTAPADTPFDFVSAEDAANPGKNETAEVPVVRSDASGDKPPSKTASGRQASQKRSSTTSKRASVVKPTSTRRASKAGSSKKVMMFSLISCGVMILIFFGLVLPNINKPRERGGGVERVELLKNFGDYIKAADQATKEALRNPSDMAKLKAGKQAIHTMRDEFEKFAVEARKLGWDEDAFAQQLRSMDFQDVQGRHKAISDAMFILEQQQKSGR